MAKIWETYKWTVHILETLAYLFVGPQVTNDVRTLDDCEGFPFVENLSGHSDPQT